MGLPQVAVSWLLHCLRNREPRVSVVAPGMNADNANYLADACPGSTSHIGSRPRRRNLSFVRVARHPDRAGASSQGSLSDDALADSAITPSATSLPKCSPNASISGCLRKYVATQIRSLPGFRFAVTPTVPMKEPSSRWRTGMSPEIYPNGGASRAGT